MRLKLERTWKGTNSTIGTLSVNGKNECFVLEDKVREIADQPVEQWKVAGQTAIPLGIYGVVITPSKRFGRDLPLLLKVDGFTGVRIHPGNGPKDTEGCLLVGAAKGPDYVSHSKEAFDRLFTKIKESLGCGEKVTLEIL